MTVGWIPLVDATRSYSSSTQVTPVAGCAGVVATDLGVADDGLVSLEEIELEFSRALDLAGQNYRDVVELAATAPDRDEASRRVVDRFQISEQAACAVLGLRLEQLTVAARTVMHVRLEAAAAGQEQPGN